METIVQAPGALNVQNVQGQAIAFQCLFDSEQAGSTFVTTVNNGPTNVTLTTQVSYVAPNTVVSVGMSAEQAALFSPATYRWRMVETTSGIDRAVLAGEWKITNGS